MPALTLMLSTSTCSQRAALLEIRLSAWNGCAPSFCRLQRKIFWWEVFSPDPSKKCKSQKTRSRMAAGCWCLLLCRREAAAEGTHGLLPLLLFPFLHQPSSILENFLISRGEPKAGLALPGLMFALLLLLSTKAHSDPALIQNSGSDTLRKNPRIPEWVGLERSSSSSLLPQTGTPSTITGIPVQLKPGHFQGFA